MNHIIRVVGIPAVCSTQHFQLQMQGLGRDSRSEKWFIILVASWHPGWGADQKYMKHRENHVENEIVF